jgi:hypothetical protein
VEVELVVDDELNEVNVEEVDKLELDEVEDEAFEDVGDVDDFEDIDEDEPDDTDVELVDGDERVLLLDVFEVDEEVWDTVVVVVVEVIILRLMQEHFRFLVRHDLNFTGQ